MSKRTSLTTLIHPKTLIVGIHAPYNFMKNSDSYFEEFKNLVRSNGVDFDQEVFIKLREIDPGYFITKGKLEEILALCKKEDIEEVIISEPLSVQQERNLSQLLGRRVFDRTQLILEIFQKGAHSAEGKTQVELAMLQHQKGRLAGRGIHMSQQAGSIGTRGPGETQKEKETQHIEYLMIKLRRNLEKLAKVRQTQRKQRLESNISQVCLIGYTNAGKSSILNALTHSNVSAADRLFETLDTTTRELYINSEKIGVISDTVGFIQQLPHNLIEAFKSTLTELQYAHLLLLVVDSSDANWEAQIKVVHDVLEELNVSKPLLYVFNKIDKVADRDHFEHQTEKYTPRIFISTLTLEGLQPLMNFLYEWHQKQL
ncbi:MAG: GTPase HflX [Candidatus Babeliaceae bacterium]